MGAELQTPLCRQENMYPQARTPTKKAIGALVHVQVCTVILKDPPICLQPPLCIPVHARPMQGHAWIYADRSSQEICVAYVQRTLRQAHASTCVGQDRTPPVRGPKHGEAHGYSLLTIQNLKEKVIFFKMSHVRKHVCVLKIK